MAYHYNGILVTCHLVSRRRTLSGAERLGMGLGREWSGVVGQGGGKARRQGQGLLPACPQR